MTTIIHVDGMTGREVTDFLITCDDARYQRWWPGVHLHLRVVRRTPEVAGSLLFMDEYVGKFRVRNTGVITRFVPGREIVWRAGRVIPLPVRLRMSFEDDKDGVTVTHTIEAGFGGVGRVLNPLLRLHFSRAFGQAMDEHVRTEFPRLRDLLRRERPA